MITFGIAACTQNIPALVNDIPENNALNDLQLVDNETYKLGIKNFLQNNGEGFITVFSKNTLGVKFAEDDWHIIAATAEDIIAQTCYGDYTIKGHHQISDSTIFKLYDNMYNNGFEFAYNCNIRNVPYDKSNIRKIYEKWENAEHNVFNYKTYTIKYDLLKPKDDEFNFRLRMLRTGNELSSSQAKRIINEVAAKQMKTLCGDDYNIANIRQKPTIDVIFKNPYYQVIDSVYVYEYTNNCTPTFKTNKE